MVGTGYNVIMISRIVHRKNLNVLERGLTSPGLKIIIPLRLSVLASVHEQATNCRIKKKKKKKDKRIKKRTKEVANSPVAW